MSFKDFNFKDYIQEALDEIKFKEPTPVQQKLIPVVRSGRDLGCLLYTSPSPRDA